MSQPPGEVQHGSGFKPHGGVRHRSGARPKHKDILGLCTLCYRIGKHGADYRCDDKGCRFFAFAGHHTAAFWSRHGKVLQHHGRALLSLIHSEEEHRKSINPTFSWTSDEVERFLDAERAKIRTPLQRLRDEREVTTAQVQLARLPSLIKDFTAELEPFSSHCYDPGCACKDDANQFLHTVVLDGPASFWRTLSWLEHREVGHETRMKEQMLDFLKALPATKKKTSGKSTLELADWDDLKTESAHFAARLGHLHGDHDQQFATCLHENNVPITPTILLLAACALGVKLVVFSHAEAKEATSYSASEAKTTHYIWTDQVGLYRPVIHIRPAERAPNEQREATLAGERKRKLDDDSDEHTAKKHCEQPAPSSLIASKDDDPTLFSQLATFPDEIGEPAPPQSPSTAVNERLLNFSPADLACALGVDGNTIDPRQLHTGGKPF